MKPVLPLESNPITLDDLEEVFTLFAGLDGHQREKGDIKVWMVAANVAGWTRAEVAAAALALAKSWTGFRIIPGHVTAQVNADRERIRQTWYCPAPPRELREDPAAEISWRRRAQRDYVDRALIALATGQQIEDVPMLRRAEPEPVPALPASEQTRRVEQWSAMVGSRKAIPAAREARAATDVRRRRLADLSPEERHAVRAELDARAAASAGEETRRLVREESASRVAVSSGKGGLDEDGSAGFDHEVAS